MEITLRQKKKNALLRKAEVERYYRTKFFSTFLNNFEIEGLNEQQARFYLIQLWEKGTIAAFILEGSKPLSIVPNQELANPNGELILTPYSPSEYNIYNYPTKVNLIRLRGATFIPQKPMIVNKSCVIGFAHKSHCSVRYLVDFYAEKIADVEMTINTNLFAHKLPRLVICSPEDKARVQELMNAIDNGQERLFLDVNDWQAIKNVLDSGATYIIDKLQVYKETLVNECLTMLGVDNKGGDKKERLIVDEVNANNDIINLGNSSFLDEMRLFFDNVNNILGYECSIKAKMSPVNSIAYGEIDLGGNEDENTRNDEIDN